jgi:hypothetical protein
MSWRRKSPFSSSQDAVNHMVDLLSREAERAGTPLTADEKKALLRDRSRRNPLPEVIRQKAVDLIGKIFATEDLNESVEDPKSFSSSMYWADGAGYSNILAVAEDVACDTGRTSYPQLHGWKLFKDRAQLIGCGLLAVLLMLVVVMVAGVHWK